MNRLCNEAEQKGCTLQGWRNEIEYTCKGLTKFKQALLLTSKAGGWCNCTAGPIEVDIAELHTTTLHSAHRHVPGLQDKYNHYFANAQQFSAVLAM